MSTDRTERLANVVASTLECAVTERAQFLNDVCGEDLILREEAETLLRFERNARDFIEAPAYEIAAEEVSDGGVDIVASPEPFPESKATAEVSFFEPQGGEVEPGDTKEAVSVAAP